MHQAFGEQAVEAAASRAVAAVARANAQAEDPLVGAVVPEDAYYEALRVELRKLARPH